MTEPAAIQVVRRTTILAILVVRRKIHLSRANGQVEFRTLGVYNDLGYFNIMKVFGLMLVIGGALTRGGGV